MGTAVPREYGELNVPFGAVSCFDAIDLRRRQNEVCEHCLKSSDLTARVRDRSARVAMMVSHNSDERIMMGLFGL